MTGGAPPASVEPLLLHPPEGLALFSQQPLEVNTITRFGAPPAPACAGALGCDICGRGFLRWVRVAAGLWEL